MTFSTTTALTTLHQGPLFAPADAAARGTEASWGDWASWGGLVETLSGPNAILLAAWLGLGCVLGVCLSFVVRDLRRGRAFLGGLFCGALAAAVLLMAAPRMGDTVGHGLAGAMLLLSSALMVARARKHNPEAGGKAKSQAAPAAEAADPSTPAPAPAPAPKAKPVDPAPAPEKQDAAKAAAPEKEAEADCRANGIPYHPEVVQWHQEIAQELGIEHCFSKS